MSSGKVFDVLLQIHGQELKHSRYKRVMDVIHKKYYGLSRTYAQEFCSTCPVCPLSQPQSTRAPLKPIIDTEVFHRLQMNLIDLRNPSDGEYHYIAHVIPLFTSYFPPNRSSQIKWLMKDFGLLWSTSHIVINNGSSS